MTASVTDAGDFDESIDTEVLFKHEHIKVRN